MAVPGQRAQLDHPGGRHVLCLDPVQLMLFEERNLSDRREREACACLVVCLIGGELVQQPNKAGASTNSSSESLLRD